MAAPKTDEDDLPKVPLTWATLREAAGLFRYLWPYRVRFALALACLMAGSLVGLGFPYLAGSMVDAALRQLNEQEAHGWLQDVNWVTAGLLGVLVAQAGFAFLRSMWFIEVGERSLADLRRDAYARLIRLPMAFHSKRRVGELGSRLSADLTRIHDALIESFPHFLRQGVLLVGGLVLILATSVKLTLAMLLSVPVLAVLATVFGNRLDRLTTRAQDRLADSQVVVEETLQNIASVKAFANERFEQGRYGKALDEYVKVSVRGALYEGAFISFILIALFGSIVGVLWYGAQLVLARQLSAGELARFMLLTVYVGGAVGSFAELYGQMRRTLGASARVREILREVPEVAGGAPPAARRIKGDVAFEDVVFRYPSRPEQPVLRGATLHARPGERVALVGPSGAGKSTLVSLLLRFYEPEAGRIVIDGRPAAGYDLHELRAQVAVVPQDVVLFGGTIAENIEYGRPGATRAEVEEAARQANAHDFIAAFPEGYETRVGERGVQLSGGQRQRVAIARAILRDPAVLLLDEATSSLDSESERLVLEALDRLMRGRTALIIAHRLSTVRNADRIFVLQEGRVIESGTHAELMGRPEGVYRNLSQLQLGLDPERPSWPTDPSLTFPPTSA